MNILINVLLAIDMLVALLMTLVILMQRPKSEGLGAAFGGGVTENIFGAQTTNVLVKFTGWLAGIFFVLTFVLSVLYAQHSSSDSALHKQLMGMPTPAATASPAPAAGSPAPNATASATVSPAASAQPSATAAAVVPPTRASASPSARPNASAQPSP
jgi:preprotein translocase subunit SecG